MWPSLFGSLFVLLCFADDSLQSISRNYQIVPTSNHKLCSPVHKKIIKLDTLSLSLIVTEGKYINNHNSLWEKNDVCSFRVQSTYPKSGLIAVIQRMDLRRSRQPGVFTDYCMDYIELSAHGTINPFFKDDSFISEQHCGVIDRSSRENFKGSDLVTFYDPNGEISVQIFISRNPLEADERIEYEIVFTPYIDCSKKPLEQLKSCDLFGKVCINETFFGDSIINCPHKDCVDEDSCIIEHKDNHSNLSTGSRVVIGSISIIFIIFALFILSLWVFKKHKLLCWAEEFAHPTRPSTSQPASRSQQQVELSESTGARLAQGPAAAPAAAPHIDREKDLPPSYESLFPESPPPSIHDVAPSAPAR